MRRFSDNECRRGRFPNTSPPGSTIPHRRSRAQLHARGEGTHAYSYSNPPHVTLRPISDHAACASRTRKRSRTTAPRLSRNRGRNGKPRSSSRYRKYSCSRKEAFRVGRFRENFLHEFLNMPCRAKVRAVASSATVAAIRPSELRSPTKLRENHERRTRFSLHT